MSIVDFHSHVMPGVDDGAVDAAESAAALRALADQGVTRLIATPHVDASLTLEPRALERRMAEIDRGWERLLGARDAGSALELQRGVELNLDVPDPVLDDPRLRLAGGAFVLLEFPFMTVPGHAARALRQLRERGFLPVVAHPERYHNLDAGLRQPGEWRDAGAFLQVNGASLLGRYGRGAQQRAVVLLERGWADYLGSDYHGRGNPQVRAYEDALVDAGAEGQVDLLMRANPARLLEGGNPLPVPPLVVSRTIRNRLLRLMGRALLAGFLVLLAALARPVPVTAQAPTPTLHPDHWSVGVLRRLDAAGLLPAGTDWSSRTPREGQVAQALSHAAVVAVSRGHPMVDLIADWTVRFVSETGTVALPILAPARTIRISTEAGYRYRTGVALAGIGYTNVEDWTGADLAPDTATIVGSVAIGIRLRDRAWFGGTLEGAHGNMRLPAAEAVVRLGGIHLWGGRRMVGLGPGAGGAVVLSGSTLDAIGLSTGAPVELPGPLAFLGRLSAEALVSRVENGDVIERSWLVAARMALSPHPRLGIGITRSDMLGGQGNAPVELDNLWRALWSEHQDQGRDFNNLVLSMDARWRPPAGALPLRLWLEWGMESGSPAASPAYVLGAELGAVPGLPHLAVGVERTWFHPDCNCGTAVWYRNRSFRGGWTHRRRPLGHPLGGDGSEWRGDVRLDVGRATVAAAGWRRERGADNLFAPERAGRAAGGQVHTDLRIASRWSITGSLWLEEGSPDRWREEALELRLNGRLR